MASAHDHFDQYEKALGGGDVESGSDGKGQSHHVDDAKDSTVAPAVSLQPTRTFEAPESVRNMTPEERKAAETKLKRKIDVRLMPMIILMYILNYLDRVGVPRPIFNVTELMHTEQHCCCEIGRNCNGFKASGCAVPGLCSAVPARDSC